MQTNRWLLVLAIVHSLPFFCLGCNPSGDGCPDILASLTVRVLDVDAEPVEGLSIEVRHVDTGTLLDVSDPDIEEPGRYVIISSHHTGRGLVQNGDTIQVTAAMERERVFSQSYVIITDGCHPIRFEGPEDVQLE